MKGIFLCVLFCFFLFVYLICILPLFCAIQSSGHHGPSSVFPRTTLTVTQPLDAPKGGSVNMVSQSLVHHLNQYIKLWKIAFIRFPFQLKQQVTQF